MTITEAVRRMNTVVSGLDNEISNILNEIEPEMVETQKERLYSGLLSDGSEIKPLYTPYTTQMKLLEGQPIDRVTLRDTGGFYDGIFAAQFNNEILIDSSDQKSGELKEKYSENIFGLTSENKEDLKEITTSKLINYVKKITGF